MILSDRTIKSQLKQVGRITIHPLDWNDIQPASVDVHLFHELRTFRNANHAYIDVRGNMDGLTDVVQIPDPQPFMLHPGEFVLGCLIERITIPDDLALEVYGKSSLGRYGLLVHATAGLGDPGWDGRLTVELANVGPLPITLYAGMPIGQVVFMQMTTPVDRPYGSPGLGSKYQGDMMPAPSRLSLAGNGRGIHHAVQHNQV